MKNDAARAFERANAALSKGRYEDAVTAFREMLDLDPAEDHARIGLALALAGVGRPEEGREALEAVAAGDLSNPVTAAAQSMLVALRLTHGDAGAAVADLERIAAADPDDPHRLFSLADAYLAQGDIDRAELSARRALTLDPRSASAHMLLGRVLEAREDYRGALSEIEEAVRLDPGYAPAHSYLGWLYLVGEEWAKAIPPLQKAVKLDPDDAMSHAWLGMALAEAGKQRQALAAVRRAVDVAEDDADALRAAAQVYARLSRFTEARALFEAIVELDPEDAHSHLALGVLAGSMGDRAVAEEMHRALTKLDPEAAAELARVAGLESAAAPARRKGTAPAAAAPTGRAVYQVKVTLKGARPPIWRRLLVPGDTKLSTLHEILQVAFGWTDSHLHVFNTQRGQYSDPRAHVEGMRNEGRVTLAEVAPGEKDRLVYEYDFGDSWEHEILVEKLLPPKAGERYPRCVTGKRHAPPEDVGGVWGYESFLEAITDPDNDEHDAMLDWVGGAFDPEAFDCDGVNRGLAQLR